MDLIIDCKYCGFKHTSNLYREDESKLDSHLSNQESCPNCGKVSTYNEADYDVR